MMTAVDVEWTDGPTSEAVQEIIGKYQYGHFDGMDDSYDYSNRRDDLPAQVKYVSAYRNCSCYDAVKAELSALGVADDYDLGSLAHQILATVDLRSGYRGVRRTRISCGSRHEFYEVVTGDSPAETAPRCQLCNKAVASEDDLTVFEHHSWKPLGCKACADREADEKRLSEECRQQETKRQADHAKIVPTSIEDVEPFRVLAQWARLNKNDTLQQYRDEVARGDYDNEEIEITRVVIMSPAAYGLFCDQLLSDFDWLAGMGGTNSDHVSKYDGQENAYLLLLNDTNELELWRAEAYRVGLLVTDGNRQLVIDPQGYNYARYVGLPISGTRTEPSLRVYTEDAAEESHDFEEFAWV